MFKIVTTLTSKATNKTWELALNKSVRAKSYQDKSNKVVSKQKIKHDH